MRTDLRNGAQSREPGIGLFRRMFERPRSHIRLILAVGALFLFAGPMPTGAQDLSGISPDQIQQLMKNATPEQLQKLRDRGFPIPGGDQTQAPSASAQPEVLSPVKPAAAASTETSSLETAYSTRSGQRLRLFGYDQVGVGQAITVPQTGGVQDDYVLGSGDTLIVSLRGQENSQFTIQVDRNGQVVLPKTGPLLAAGKKLSEFKRNLEEAVHRAYVSTDVYISVDQLRQVTVMVAGEVATPGMRIVTALSNPLDAILLSGGITKSGSIRSVRLIRGGQSIDIDLYGVLTRHSTANLPYLQNGDRVFVPPIGATVAVTGYVRRPAIYELRPGQSAISAQELLSYGNGPLLRGRSTTSVLRTLPNGTRQFVDISGQSGAAVRDGEIMTVKAAVDIAVGQVKLAGAVRTPGLFALDKYKTLHSVLNSTDALSPGAYVLFGFIDRINSTTLQHEALAFSPLHVIQGKDDVKLASEDTIYVLTLPDVTTLMQKISKPVGLEEGQQPNAAPPTTPQAPTASPAGTTPMAPSGMPGTAATGMNQAGTGQYAASAPPAAGMAPSAFGPAGSNAGVAPGDAASMAADAATDAGEVAAGSSFGAKLTDYQFTVEGAVHNPGTYLAAPNTTLAEVLATLGGLADDVDLSNFEVTSTRIDNDRGRSTTERNNYAINDDQMNRLILRPFDRLSFHHVYADRESGAVSLEGEVRYPGRYNVLRGERLSSVLQRAGGLTEVAYPYGTVFLRVTAAARERAENRHATSDIRSQLFAVLMQPRSQNAAAPGADTIVALQSLLTQVENSPALGRISVIADPSVLAAMPEKDPIMQPGDRVVIPKVPSSISVLGEVMRPGNFLSDKSMSVSDYVDMAGGYTEFADSSRVIIVYPDGRAVVHAQSWFSFGFGGEQLPPGTSIVVSRDLSALTFHQLVVDTTQIVSQLATTAAALAVLTTNLKP